MNLGAKTLRAAAGDATIEEIADALDIERTYCGRLLSDERTPGLGLRRKIRDRYGVGIEDWDQKVANPKRIAETRKPTGTHS